MGLKEQIYLLEVQVHDPHLESVKELECMDDEQDFKIYAHFLSFEPVLIYDNLNYDYKALPILFKMNPEELINAIDRSPLTLSVAGMLSEYKEYTVGTVKVLFNETFAEAITMATSSVMFPVIAQIDEDFSFRNLYHEESGFIGVSIKLNCFGNIDIKRFGPCEKEQDDCAEKAYKANVQEKNNESITVELQPIVTDLERISPATALSAKYDGVKQTIPWKMTGDELAQPAEAPAPQGRRESKVESPAGEFTLKCTCDEIPDFMNDKPSQPITLKCQCAEILAAMKACFPDMMGTANEEVDETQQPTPQLQPPIIAQEEYKEPPQKANMDQIRSPVNITPSPTADNIIPTSAVCGLELKSSNNASNKRQQEQAIVSEEKVNPVNVKPEIVRTGLSTHEIVLPESRNEESSKKVNENKNGAPWEERKPAIKKAYKKKAKKANDVYEFTAGMYPGMVIGHKYCIPSIRMVPKNMGWMWNLLDLFSRSKKHRGWRPGAMLKTVANNFGSWNRAAGFKDGDEVETFFNFKKKKTAKDAEAKSKQPQMNKPTLHVHKKDKFYHITVNPPGDSNVKPISFKVDPRKASSDEETSSESTSDDSFEFEYTVPAALLPPPRKIEWATANTQYNDQDFLPKTKKQEGPCPAEEPKEPPKEKKEKKEAKAGKDKGKGKKKK